MVELQEVTLRPWSVGANHHHHDECVVGSVEEKMEEARGPAPTATAVATRAAVERRRIPVNSECLLPEVISFLGAPELAAVGGVCRDWRSSAVADERWSTLEEHLAQRRQRLEYLRWRPQQIRRQQRLLWLNGYVFNMLVAVCIWYSVLELPGGTRYGTRPAMQAFIGFQLIAILCLVCALSFASRVAVEWRVQSSRPLSEAGRHALRESNNAWYGFPEAPFSPCPVQEMCLAAVVPDAPIGQSYATYALFLAMIVCLLAVTVLIPLKVDMLWGVGQWPWVTVLTPLWILCLLWLLVPIVQGGGANVYKGSRQPDATAILFARDLSGEQRWLIYTFYVYGLVALPALLLTLHKDDASVIAGVWLLPMLVVLLLPLYMAVYGYFTDQGSIFYTRAALLFAVHFLFLMSTVFLAVNVLQPPGKRDVFNFAQCYLPTASAVLTPCINLFHNGFTNALCALLDIQPSWPMARV